jgi:hypothetical protein
LDLILGKKAWEFLERGGNNMTMESLREIYKAKEAAHGLEPLVNPTQWANVGSAIFV